MKRFVEGADRKRAVLLPEYLEDYVSDDNPVRVSMSSSMSLIFVISALTELLPQKRDGPRIIHPCCSRFISTAI